MPYRRKLPVLIFLLLCWSVPALWVQAGQHVPVPDREANETTRRGAVTNITVSNGCRRNAFSIQPPRPDSARNCWTARL